MNKPTGLRYMLRKKFFHLSNSLVTSTEMQLGSEKYEESLRGYWGIGGETPSPARTTNDEDDGEQPNKKGKFCLDHHRMRGRRREK